MLVMLSSEIKVYDQFYQWESLDRTQFLLLLHLVKSCWIIWPSLPVWQVQKFSLVIKIWTKANKQTCWVDVRVITAKIDGEYVREVLGLHSSWCTAGTIEGSRYIPHQHSLIVSACTEKGLPIPYSYMQIRWCNVVWITWNKKLITIMRQSNAVHTTVVTTQVSSVHFTRWG